MKTTIDDICFMYGKQAAVDIWNSRYPKYIGPVRITASNVLANNNELQEYCELRRKVYLDIFGEF